MELQTTVRSAFVLVNGIQLMQCSLPTVSERSCTVYSETLSNLRISGDYGRLEMHCVFYASADTCHQADRPWIGELLIDGTDTIYLGQLPGGTQRRGSTSVSRFVATYPRTLEFRVTHLQQDFYRHPEEDMLVDEIQLLLRDGHLFPGGDGGVPHTNIQSRVEKLAVYQRIITEHYNGKWFDFLLRQQSSLHLLPQPGEETRVALRREGEAARNTPHVDAVADEKALLEAVVRILEVGDLTYVELLGKLESVPAFVDRLNPSHQILFRFLQSHSETFWVKTDPMHTTRVGLLR